MATAYLSGDPDRARWLERLRATAESDWFTACAIEVGVFDDEQLIASNRAPALRYLGGVVRDDSSERVADEIRRDFRRWANGPGLPPVAAWSRVIATDGARTPLLNIAALRASTGPSVAPVAVVYVWRSAERPAPAIRFAEDFWAIAGTDESHAAWSPTARDFAGLTRWMILHPEDVVATLEPSRGIRFGTLDRYETTVRVLTAHGWARARLSHRPMATPTGIDLASWIQPLDGDRRQSIRNPESELSVRELEVFRLLVAGMAAVTIARRLGIASSTVRTITARVLTKLNARSRTQLRERYDPRSREAARRALATTRTFGEVLPEARSGEPRFLHAPGPRAEWIAQIARTIDSPLLAFTNVGIALLDGDEIVAANEAFRLPKPTDADTLPIAEVDPDNEREVWRRESFGAAGVWSFTMRKDHLLLTIAVISREQVDGDVALVYKTDPALARYEPARVGWVIIDARWQVRAVSTTLAAAAFATRMLGVVMWPFVHPSVLPELIDNVRSVIRGDVLDIELVHDAARRYGWTAARSRLRRIDSSDEPLVLWEFGPSLGTPTFTADPTAIAALDEHDIPLGVAALAGVSVAELAEHFDLAPGTVRNRLSAIYRRLGVRGQRELVERYGTWR